MNYLIVGKNKYVFLAISIYHRKCHFIMIKFTEIRVKLHVFQEVVHPAHIPLEGKSKPVLFRLSCHLRPCCGFLRDHHRSMISSQNNGIQMLEKFNGFQILVFAVFICHPLSVFFSVIKIKHGGNCVYAKTVHVTLLHPEKCVRNKEVLHLRSSVIINLCAPVRVLSLSRIFMFIHSRSVKVCKTVRVFREMSRNPVKNDADFLSVQIIHQVFEILRCSVS